MSRYLIICLMLVTIGCEGSIDRENRPPRRGRRHKPDTPIVEPIKDVSGRFTLMQKAQIASRVTMFKELAAGVRDGSVRTMFDVNKAVTESQIAAGTKVNEEIGERFSAEIQNGDNLKSDAATKFEVYAAELETLIK